MQRSLEAGSVGAYLMEGLGLRVVSFVGALSMWSGG